MPRPLAGCSETLNHFNEALQHFRIYSLSYEALQRFIEALSNLMCHCIAEVFNLWSADPWGSEAVYQGVCERKPGKNRKRSATELQRRTCSSFTLLFKKSTTLYLLADFLTVNETSTEPTVTLVSTVLNHIQQLSHYFREYFGGNDMGMFDWIQNPFESQLTDVTGREQEELAELSSDRTLHLQFNQMSLIIIIIIIIQRQLVRRRNMA